MNDQQHGLQHRTDPAHHPPQNRSGFHFTGRMRAVCEDMVMRLPQLDHIDMRRVAVAFAQARKSTSYGIFASLTPMRFEDGAAVGERRGRNYSVERLYDGHGREMLYILSFYLPRFMELDFKEKLVTIFHELWHISPDFNGDLRRHPGRCYAHTHSQKEYDAEMGKLADEWLAASPPESLFAFLRYDFTELKAKFGGVYGAKIRRPKLIPI